jgi:hypothetical protein
MIRALLTGVLVLAGCATQKPLSPELVEEVEKPLICSGSEQCSLFWQRSLFYVNHHSAFKIQTANESLIQTFSPTGGSPSIAFNISKEPLSGGAIRIWAKIYCDNMFGCVPDVPSEMVRFKRYIRTGM